jgi:GNAT superfamily N-acetyltransferase
MNMGAISAIADEWWSRDFGCAPSELRPARTHVQEHAGELTGNPGIWILVAGGAPRISLPPTAIEALAVQASTWSEATVADATILHSQVSRLQSQKVDKIIGPAFIGYGSSITLDLADADHARRLADNDQDAVSALRTACSTEEWEHGGNDSDDVPLFGARDADGSLSALASYETWGGKIAHISIVTHPERRRLGLGRRAVALAAQDALGAGLVPQYRTLRANTASLRIAQRLGFVEYGFSVYVGLRAA